MGKIKDFLTKIGVTDTEPEDNIQDAEEDTKQPEPPAKEEPTASHIDTGADHGKSEEKPGEQFGAGFGGRGGRTGKVVNISDTASSIREGNKGMHTGPRSVNTQANNMKVVVIQPRSLDDSQQIANCLKEKRPVIINFENVDDQLYRRILDFVSGTTYALDGSVNSISSRVWLFSPKTINVDVNGQGNNKQDEMPWEKK